MPVFSNKLYFAPIFTRSINIPIVDDIFCSHILKLIIVMYGLFDVDNTI